MMVSENTSRFQTAFTVSIDARKGVSTGISAADRATTILTTVDENAQPEDLVSPGHVFSVKSNDRVACLVRTGQDRGFGGSGKLSWAETQQE